MSTLYELKELDLEKYGLYKNYAIDFIELINKIPFNELSDLEKLFDIEIQLGNIDGLQVLGAIKKLEEICKLLRASQVVQQSAIDELDKYGKEDKPVLHGCAFSKSRKVNYQYKKEMLQELEGQQKNIKQIVDEIKKIAKTASGIVEWYNPETGELQKIYPAIKEETEIIQVSLK